MNSLTGYSLILGLLLGLGLFVMLSPAPPARAEQRRVRPINWRMFAMSLGIGFVTTVLTWAISGVIGLSVAIGGLGMGVLPWLAARRNRKKLEAEQSAFPEMLETLISRLRSGDTLLGALGRSGRDAPEALAHPLSVFALSYINTGNADVCLTQLKTEWGSATGDLIVETIRVAHFTGGANTLQVLRDLADQVRRDSATQRDIRAKQSWVHVAARVGVAAPWIVLVFLSFRSEAVAAYNSSTGVFMLIGGLALTVGAYWLMVSLGGRHSSRRVFSS